MKVANILGYAMLLAGTTLAAPLEDGYVDAPLEDTYVVAPMEDTYIKAREVLEYPAVLEKRTGHIDVTTWSGSKCGGTNQGTTQVGTGGKCVNSSNAGSVHIGGASGLNPSGCKQVHAQYFLNTGCGGTKGVSATYDANTCHSLAPNQNSAMMKCIS